MKKKTLLLASLLSFIIVMEGVNTKASAKNIATKSGKKVMKQKREDLFESLEEKVFRAPNGTKAKMQATDSAFDTGKKRMYYLQREEDQIRVLESELGMEEVNHNFITEKYDALIEEFNTTKNEIEALEIENREFKEYLARLNAMELRAKGGKNSF